LEKGARWKKGLPLDQNKNPPKKKKKKNPRTQCLRAWRVFIDGTCKQQNQRMLIKKNMGDHSRSNIASYLGLPTKAGESG